MNTPRTRFIQLRACPLDYRRNFRLGALEQAGGIGDRDGPMKDVLPFEIALFANVVVAGDDLDFIVLHLRLCNAPA